MLQFLQEEGKTLHWPKGYNLFNRSGLELQTAASPRSSCIQKQGSQNPPSTLSLHAALPADFFLRLFLNTGP